MDDLNYVPPKPRLKRRAFLAGAGGLGLALAGGAFVAINGRKSGGKAEISIQYDWLMSTAQVGDVIARDKGFFDAEGLSVSFATGGPNAQTVPAVLSGNAQVGQMTTAQVLSAFAAHRPVKTFACGFQYFPYSIFSLPRHPVRSPRDLIGRTVGVNPSVGATLKRILASENVRPDQVRIVTIGADMTPLLTGQVDAVGGFATNTKALSVLGPERIEMESRHVGLHGYANAYWTSSDTYEAEKDTLIRLVRGLSRGWAWAYHNRKAAVDRLCDAYPLLDRTSELATIDRVMEISFDQDTRAHGWGWFEDARLADEIRSYQNVTHAFGGAIPQPSDVATHEILLATDRVRPRLG